MLPAVLAITHTLTTYYIFSGLAVKGLNRDMMVYLYYKILELVRYNCEYSLIRTICDSGGQRSRSQQIEIKSCEHRISMKLTGNSH